MNIPRKKTAYEKETQEELGIVLLTSVCYAFCNSYISYFVAAAIEHHDQKQLAQEFILEYFSRGTVHIMGGTAAGNQRNAV